MSGYDNDGEYSVVAQSCKYFRPNEMTRRGYGMQENISCRICCNSTGTKCIKNVFDPVATRLGLD